MWWPLLHHSAFPTPSSLSPSFVSRPRGTDTSAYGAYRSFSTCLYHSGDLNGDFLGWYSSAIYFFYLSISSCHSSSYYHVLNSLFFETLCKRHRCESWFWFWDYSPWITESRFTTSVVMVDLVRYCQTWTAVSNRPPSYHFWFSALTTSNSSQAYSWHSIFREVV